MLTNTTPSLVSLTFDITVCNSPLTDFCFYFLSIKSAYSSTKNKMFIIVLCILTSLPVLRMHLLYVNEKWTNESNPSRSTWECEPGRRSCCGGDLTPTVPSPLERRPTMTVRCGCLWTRIRNKYVSDYEADLASHFHDQRVICHHVFYQDFDVIYFCDLTALTPLPW